VSEFGAAIPKRVQGSKGDPIVGVGVDRYLGPRLATRIAVLSLPVPDSVTYSAEARTLALWIEREWARAGAAFTRRLHSLHSRWEGAVHAIGNGYAILAGPGLYVNRATGIGLDEHVEEQAFSWLEGAAARVGVPPLIETTPFADPNLGRIAETRGYRRSAARAVFAKWTSTPSSSAPPARAEFVEVLDEAGLGRWQEVAAGAFGKATPSTRAAGNAYAATSFAVAEDRLFVATDPDGEDVACCSLSVRDGLATTGGMGVTPTARGRGIQSALIDARVDVARLRGAELAASSTFSEQSRRNLVECGFVHLYDQSAWTRPMGSA
jgi:GNAT superfamily N-acetyltransferase